MVDLPNYERMYFRLAARVADAIDLLVAAQRECEDLYIADGDSDAEAPRIAEQTAAMLKELLISEAEKEKADGA